MIPQIIHYCWFGGKPLPPLAIKCINSWKEYLPNYEIREWNESNFNINMIPYIADAYKEKKFAFVSDFVRFYVLYEYGGLYFDTDVEIIKSMDSIINQGPFLGCEHEYVDGNNPNALGVAPGLGIGSTPKMPFLKKMIDYYRTISFYKEDGSYNQVTIVQHTTSILVESGLVNTPHIQNVEGFYIYPKEYFCPLEYTTGVLTITDKTYTIHHYMASWITKGQRLYVVAKKILGEKTAQLISNTLKKYKIIK